MFSSALLPPPLARLTAIHACGDALFRINGTDIAQDELDDAYGHPVKAVHVGGIW
jgi:hypothetical protein